MSQLTLSSTVKRDLRLACTDMDGDTVVLNIDGSEYIGLGGIGPHVWELLERPVTVAAIVTAICSEYAIDSDACQSDILSFLSHLMQHGLIELQASST